MEKKCVSSGHMSLWPYLQWPPEMVYLAKTFGKYEYFIHQNSNK